jgi:hypothetical protein
MNVTKEFEKWAKGFSGCNGGNLHGALWFCGIEWGMGKDHEIGEELARNVSKPPQIYESAEDILKNATTGKPYPYGIKLIKLITAIRGGSVSDYRRVASGTPFPFHRDSDFFQLNLFPVAFKEVDPQLWIDKYKTAIGLPTRDAYVRWCRENRFPQMRSWVEKGKPKLIVGIGAGRERKPDFKEAFGFTAAWENEETIEGKKLVWMRNGKAILAIIPFLGYQNGLLNTDQLVEAFGERLGAILNGQEGAARSRTTFTQPRATRRVVRIPPTPKTVAQVPAPIGTAGWGLTFGSALGSDAMRINRRLCDVPKTIAEICTGTAHDRLGPQVKEARAREHLKWHWEGNSGAARAPEVAHVCIGAHEGFPRALLPAGVNEA